MLQGSRKIYLKSQTTSIAVMKWYLYWNWCHRCDLAISPRKPPNLPHNFNVQPQKVGFQNLCHYSFSNVANYQKDNLSHSNSSLKSSRVQKSVPNNQALIIAGRTIKAWVNDPSLPDLDSISFADTFDFFDVDLVPHWESWRFFSTMNERLCWLGFKFLPSW